MQLNLCSRPVVAWGWRGRGAVSKKEEIAEGREEMFGGDGYVSCLVCGDGFHSYVKTAKCAL